MRVSHRWLTELLPDLNATPADLAEKLTRGGLEVEAMETFGQGNDQVLVAEVLKVEPHPSRDKLSLVTVSLGGGRGQRVVCGASNVPAPGGRVALAPEGAYLPAVDLTLTPKKIAGVESAGMLCSEVELGLADGSDGILILDSELTPGTRLTDALPETQDTIFEIGVTPNRPDALGHIGIARDVAALYRLEFRRPSPGTLLRTSDESVASKVRVDNRDTERCPRYLASLVTGVRIGPSPRWLRYRLWSLGIRPISNVVDVTNLLLLEYGQPMHAFDLDRVEGRHIIVRRATAGEPFTTLDGVARKLDEDDLVICDDSGPTALAGVMGGEHSEIRETTRDVLLECAYFSPRGIRRAGRRHGMHTESSHRFERGTDPGGVDHVMERARVLLTELADGTALAGNVEASGERPKPATVTLRSTRLDAMMGIHVPFDEARAILTHLGFDVRDGASADTLDVTCPTWRPDISMEADLIEEVARIRGLDEIPVHLPAIAPQKPRTSGRLARLVASEALNLGLSEAVCYAFVSPRELEAVRAPEATVALDNPLTEERSVMRTSLLPGLLEAVRRARRRGEGQARLFGVGSLFLPPTNEAQSPAAAAARPRIPSDAVLPEERLVFSAVLAGPRPGYLGADEPVDVYDAKGLAESLVERILGRTPRTKLAGSELPHLHPRGAAHLEVEGVRVGRFGPLHPEVVDALDLGGPVLVVELDLVSLEAIPTEQPRYRPIARLPAVSRDLAVVVPETLPAAEVEATITAAAGELCESVGLFDVFTGQGIPEGHRSLAYRVVYRDPKAATDPEAARTLTDKEVEQTHQRVRAAAGKLGQLRA